MSTITTRAGKGSPLTNNEVDANFTNLNTDKAELSGAAFTGAITTTSTVDGRDVATDGSKLDGIEASADVTDTTNVTAAGALMDSEVTNLAQVKAFDSADYATAAQGTTADAALPRTGGAMTGAITTNSTFDGRDVATDGTKLDGIEASADVTDTANVTAAGALMDSELTAIASVKALNQGVATTDSPTFAGLTTSADINFGDNDKAVFGAGSDLQIYHDGSASRIVDAGTGGLTLQADANVVIQNSAGTETKAEFTTDGGVNLYHNNAIKLATTSTGIDVTGSVVADTYNIGTVGTLGSVSTDRLFLATADGLGLQFDFDNSRIVPVGANGSTYNNNVNLGASGLEFKNFYLSGTATMGAATVQTTGSTTAVLTLNNADGNGTLSQINLGYTGDPDHGNIKYTGAMSFQTGGNQTALTLASNGNATFSGSVTTENHFAVIPPTTTNYAYMDYSNAGGSMYVGRERSSASGLLTGSTAYAGVINVTGAYPLEFGTNNSKRMTIDSSGNLLVGKSATAFGTAGVEASASSGLWSTRSGFPPLALNRLSTDGSIADFYKDGTTVGSIGTPFTGELYIAASGANSSGLLLTESNAVRPMKNGSASDATQDLGRINGRWKDLYLSGGVYLGGTGAAHLLDDYEEVNFTATLRGSGAEPATLITVTGFATKIGRVVQYSIGFENVDTTGYTGNLTVTGLPFTNNGGRAIGNIVGYLGLTFAGSQSFSVISVGSTNLEALSISSNGAWAASTHNPRNTVYFWLTGTYMTTA